MNIGINHASANFDHTILAEVISSRCREDLRFFTLNREARGARPEASWLQQPANSALELHWSRRCPCIPTAELPPPMQAKLLGGYGMSQQRPVCSRFECIALLLHGPAGVVATTPRPHRAGPPQAASGSQIPHAKPRPLAGRLASACGAPLRVYRPLSTGELA